MAAAALAKSFAHPDELLALALYSWQQWTSATWESKTSPAPSRTTLVRCYHFLDKTSRSFSAVIRALHPELRDPVCIFYLALRGLDTIEDDMTIPTPLKLDIMRQFHLHLVTPGWTFTGNGPMEKDRALLCEYHVVVSEVLELEPKYRDIICDITKRMAEGMCDYLGKQVLPLSTSCPAPQAELPQAQHLFKRTLSPSDSGINISEKHLDGHINTIEEYQMYCHFVAGLVGHGLTHLFVASGLESLELTFNDMKLANSMGLFLQNVNIIRDFREDLEQGRMWWPKDVWGNYVDEIHELTNAKDNYSIGRAALNHMCLVALGHIPDVLHYLSMIRDPSVFRFCAIPQVMAIATLSEVFDNAFILSSTIPVKIRKGLAVKLVLKSTDMAAVRSFFLQFCTKLCLVATTAIECDSKRIDTNILQQTIYQCKFIIGLCKQSASVPNSPILLRLSRIPTPVLGIIHMAIIPAMAMFLFKRFSHV